MEPDYRVILLYQVKDGKEQLLFDSRTTLVQVAGIKLRKAKGEFITHNDMCANQQIDSYFETFDSDRNGYPEYVFCSVGAPSVPGHVIIIEKQIDKTKIIFNSSLVSYNFNDIDNDGKTELYGATYYGYAQTQWFGWARIGVFEMVDGVYKQSSSKIKSYRINHAKLLESKINNGEIDKDIMLTLLIDYSYTGDMAKGEDLIKKHFDLIYNTPNYMDYIREDYRKLTKEECKNLLIKTLNEAIQNNIERYKEIDMGKRVN